MIKFSVGQRWKWIISKNTPLGFPSEVIFEINRYMSNKLDSLHYDGLQYNVIQVLSKGFEIDYVGYEGSLPVGFIELNKSEFSYLEGQDKPITIS